MRETKLFKLKIGDSFRLYSGGAFIYTITGFKYKRMPRIGKTLNMVTKENPGNTTRHFINNHDVFIGGQANEKQ